LRAHKADKTEDEATFDYLQSEYGYDLSDTDMTGKKTTVPLAVELIVQDLAIESCIIDTFYKNLGNEINDGKNDEKNDMGSGSEETIIDNEKNEIIGKLIGSYSLTIAHLCRDVKLKSPGSHTNANPESESVQDMFDGILSAGAAILRRPSLFLSFQYVGLQRQLC
jgi:hypothetical protein